MSAEPQNSEQLVLTFLAEAGDEYVSGEAISDKGGMDAANLKVAQEYVAAFSELAKQSNTLIVPANAVDTYDLPPDEAEAIGAFAHPGDFFHQTFLYHMALNGIRVVSELT